MGTLPKIEFNTKAKLAYTPFIQEQIMAFIVEVNKEYNRVYETAGRYPDVALTMLTQAFSEALFENKDIVTVEHVLKAVENTKSIYPDVKAKEVIKLKEKFKELFEQEEELKKDFNFKDY